MCLKRHKLRISALKVDAQIHLTVTVSKSHNSFTISAKVNDLSKYADLDGHKMLGSVHLWLVTIKAVLRAQAVKFTVLLLC